MLRRFEVYAIAPDALASSVEAMERAMRDCASYIPEVLHSAVGHARSDTVLNFVWEHAYASPESYRRYMAHPFHAAILDRYLLNDSPERIIADNDHGLGLAGYRCDTPEFLLPAGAARRLVALRLRADAASEFQAIARSEAQRSNMLASVFADNYFGPRWFDGESWTGPEPGFTHLWEQGFASLEDALGYEPEWHAKAEGLIEQSLELVYAIRPGAGYGA